MNNSIVKFSKVSKFQSPIFVSTTEIDTKTYEVFSKLAHVLDEKFPDQFKNVFENDSNNIFIQCFKHPTQWEQGRRYKINWNAVNRKKKNGTLYVAIKLSKVTPMKMEPEKVEDIFRF